MRTNKLLKGVLSRFLGRDAVVSRELEGLENRSMLSGGLGTPEMVPWGRGVYEAVAGSWIVSFDDRVDASSASVLMREAATRLGVTATGTRLLGMGYAGLLQTDALFSRSAAERVAAELPGITQIVPDVVVTRQSIPNDTQFGSQWHLRNVGQSFNPQTGELGTIGADINVLPVWNGTVTGSEVIGSRDVVVAVIDSGVDTTHPDLRANMWVNPGEIAGNGIDDDGNGFVDDINGFDFADRDANPADDSAQPGHGTAVAGLIGAVGNNNLGVTGVAWNVSIIGLKIARSDGRLVSSAIIESHDYLTALRARGINVVASNNSYGTFAPAFYEDFDGGIAAERAAIQRFIDSGATFVVSAGNESNDNDSTFTSFPASYNLPGMIAVAASDENDGIANFSSFGAQSVAIAAPGRGNIVTLAPGGGLNFFFNGTSASGPIVAGAVALIKTVKPSASAVEIREAIINSARPSPAFQGRVLAGGVLDVANAIRQINISGPVVRAVDPGPVVTQINPTTGTPFNAVTVTLSKPVDTSLLNTASASLVRVGTGATIPISSVTTSTDRRVVTLALNMAGLSGGRLPVDTYTLTLQAGAFRDDAGNFLNGNSASGQNTVYQFAVRGATGENEQNDTLATATVIPFGTSGEVTLPGLTLGNGTAATLDVDLYRIDLPRGGLISAEVTARRLGTPSTLDAVLRLFNARGEELSLNDQAFGDDPALDFFVSTGGSYYIGVSGFSNTRYNPNVQASGSSQSTGLYNLRVRVTSSTDDVASTAGANVPGTPIVRIPTDPTADQGVSSAFIDITDTRRLLDVNVRFNISHSFTGDLRISLVSPNSLAQPSRTVVLVDRRGGAGDDFGTRDGANLITGFTTMDDEAATAVSTASAPFLGSLRPDNSLGAFDGLVAAGRWTLLINDTTALNTGQLWGWGLELTFTNDTFGPFESNETLTTANVLTEVNGTGTATREAFVGDGGFGAFDRDVYRFVANAGSTLTAEARSAGTVNTLMRLFDAAGNQVLISDLGDTLDSRFSGFIFATSGTYYLAVSESANKSYNVRAIADGTGVAAATTGAYTLSVTLAAGVSDATVPLNASNVNAQVQPNGLFGFPGLTGNRLSFNGIEFLAGDSRQFIGGVASAFAGNNAVGGTVGASSDVPFTLTSTSDSANRSVFTEGTLAARLKVERRLSYAVSDNFIAVDVTLRNLTSGVLSDVQWMESFNPDQGLAAGTGSRSTILDRSANGKLSLARVDTNAFRQGLTVALAVPEADTRLTTAVLPSTEQSFRDAGRLRAFIAGNPSAIDPNGVASDGSLAMHFGAGDLAAGGSSTFRYFIFLGSTQASVEALNASMNAGTGTGHLTRDPRTPAAEILQTGGAGTAVPTLPYKVYYPEGFAGSDVFTFVPIANPNSEPARVFVVARTEFGTRDQVIQELTIPAQSRSGITIFERGRGGLVTPGAPYAVEVRSSLPVSAIFSHYDLSLLTRPSAVGEAFTSETSTTWSFGRVVKTADNSAFNFLLFYNPTATTTQVTATFFPVSGSGAPVTVAFSAGGLEGFRRGGLAINDIAQLPAGEYGVVLTSGVPIVASLSTYDRPSNAAEGLLGNVGSGATSAVLPEGQFGLNADVETLGVLNAGDSASTVTLSFVFNNGTTYRSSVTVQPRSFARVNVADLPAFPRSGGYGLSYTATQPVSLSVLSEAFNDGVSTAFSARANTYWGFGEGFRPADGSGHPGVLDYLRVYNPNPTDAVIEIGIFYDDGPSGGNRGESFRRVVPGRTIAEFNADQFVVGARRAQNSFFGMTVKSPTPVVATLGHFDRLFPGAFGTLGTPLGISQPVT